VNHQYEVEVEYNNQYLLVYANLYSHGVYDEDEQGIEILESPVFCDYEVVQDTDNEVSKEELVKVLKIAENILENVYWSEGT
jgi:hypothetical protein